MSRRRRAAEAVAVLLVCLLSSALRWPSQQVLARMSVIETVPSTFSTDTLHPPTSLSATRSGLGVSLTWTATVDPRATGYQVLRSTTNGGPYTQIATVTPRTTTSYLNSPVLPGMYYYVLQTYFGSWTSGNSNQASVLAL